MKIGFVAPWFGWDIPGGAEAELRGLAVHLREAGLEVEILTTCVEKFASDWNKNFYKSGASIENGVMIRRFKADKWDRAAFDAANIYFLNLKGPFSNKIEQQFINSSVNSAKLYKYIAENKEEYALFVFIPYMFGTTYYGIKAAPEKSVLIPCLHEESYAHLRIFAELFKDIKGMAFNSVPESELAHSLFDLSNVMTIIPGIGVDPVPESDGKRFRNKYGIDKPYILYAGRKDAGKNVDTLIRHFSEYRRRNRSDLELVLIGGGEIMIPDDMNGEITDLGFVNLQDKYDAYSGSEFLCQPSTHESFSIVIMESWLCERPVLVSEKCPVTKDFVQRANGGLYFSDYHEFEATLEFFEKNGEAAELMGRNGKKFVTDNFLWEKVTENYINFFNELVK